MADFAHPHNRVFLSPSKNAFLLNALVSLECDTLEHGLLSWGTQIGGGRQEKRAKYRCKSQRLKGRKFQFFIFLLVSLITRIMIEIMFCDIHKWSLCVLTQLQNDFHIVSLSCKSFTLTVWRNATFPVVWLRWGFCRRGTCQQMFYPVSNRFCNEWNQNVLYEE